MPTVFEKLPIGKVNYEATFIKIITATTAAIFYKQCKIVTRYDPGDR